MTKVVNIYKEKYDVYIGRAGKGKDGYFGNPFKLSKEENREEILNKYSEYFYNRINEVLNNLRNCLKELKEKDLINKPGDRCLRGSMTLVNNNGTPCTAEDYAYAWAGVDLDMLINEQGKY
ncbi:MAG: DUF4326 domain-containing protein [Elusimicrobia bacterium]|nr:DUF4326 domain-containing protein [Elusimicrobiota bacterium]